MYVHRMIIPWNLSEEEGIFVIYILFLFLFATMFYLLLLSLLYLYTNLDLYTDLYTNPYFRLIISRYGYKYF